MEESGKRGKGRRELGGGKREKKKYTTTNREKKGGERSDFPARGKVCWEKQLNFSERKRGSPRAGKKRIQVGGRKGSILRKGRAGRAGTKTLFVNG